MKGKLPISQMIELESNEEQWRILASGIINELRMTAIVEKEPNYKVRIKLVIQKIIPPERVIKNNICRAKTSLGENIGVALSRSIEFMSNYLDKSVWLFLGYIDGESKSPILILHYKSINITVYTQKKEEEDSKNFFPELN